MKRPRVSRIDPFTAELGVLSDAVIAKKAGVCTEAVRLYRNRRGILSARQRRVAGLVSVRGGVTAGAPPVHAITTSTNAPRFLFDVVFASPDQSVLVVAHNVISALSIARHAYPDDEIVKVEKSPATANMPVLE